MKQFKMPQLGETVLEATVTRWLKRPGDMVQLDEPLVEVSTDKVDSEIPSPTAGALTRILVQEGETIPVGAVMAEIDGELDGSTAKGVASGQSRAPAPPPPVEAPPAEPPQPAGEATAESGAAAASQPSPKPAGRSSPPPGSEVRDVVAAPDGPQADQPFRAVLSPLVRKLAGEHGVDLSKVAGTGAGGRITKQDVLKAAASRSSDPPSAPAQTGRPPSGPAVTAEASRPQVPASPEGLEEIVQVGPMRRVIAEHMVSSSNETARAWNTIEVDLTRVGRLRAKAGPGFNAREGFSLTWMPFVSKALTQALLAYPQLNSTWNGDGTITR